MSRFIRDIQIGKIAELTLQSLLTKAGVEATFSKGKAPYDLNAQLGDKSVKFEVKYDVYAARSGNVAIEFYNPKQCKPSGIDATTADLWVHMVNEPASLWIASVPRLKEYISNNKPFRVVSCGGDNNASFYLYRQEKIFSDLFTRIDDKPGEEIKQIMTSLL